MTTAKRITFTLLLLIIGVTSLLVTDLKVLAADPVVVTGAATNTTESSATLNGTLSSLGTVSSTYVYLNFDYCTDAHWDLYGDYDQVTEEIPWLVDNGVTTFSAGITDLLTSTDYHFRAKIRYGTSYIYGSDETFNTNFLEPDSVPEIIQLQAYKDLLEIDDCLFVILADIPYQTTPSIPVNRSFIWRLMMDGFGEVGWNVGYAMNDLGYGINLYALYFDAADGIDWGNDEDYNIELGGAPAVFGGSPPEYDDDDDPNYFVTADTWVAATDYNEKLAEDLLAMVSTLEQEWQILLLDEQDTKTVLSSNGEKLLRNVIPGAQYMAPSLFYVQNVAADVEERAWTGSLDQTYKERLLGPDGQPGGGDDNWVATSFVGVADWLNIPWLLFMGIVCFGTCAFVVYLSIKKFLTPVPGYLGSLLVILCFGLLVLGLGIVALVAFALVFMGGWIIFFRKA